MALIFTYLFLFWEHLAVFRDYFWLCSQELLWHVWGTVQDAED